MANFDAPEFHRVSSPKEPPVISQERQIQMILPPTLARIPMKPLTTILECSFTH